MELKNIKRPYDLIVSLGKVCGPAAHLRRLGLRRFSMPLDWVVSSSLPDVSLLLSSRFRGYMELQNMERVNGEANFFDENRLENNGKSYFIRDNKYNIISVHDFPIIPGKSWQATYSAFKIKIRRRITRLYRHLGRSSFTLFIRYVADYEETVELVRALKSITRAPFHLLIVNPVEGAEGVTEIDWGLDHVCVAQVSEETENVVAWDTILEGVTLTLEN